VVCNWLCGCVMCVSKTENDGQKFCYVRVVQVWFMNWICCKHVLLPMFK
jgi:hypothetical protein